jgi:hypothetical protein
MPACETGSAAIEILYVMLKTQADHHHVRGDGDN